MPSPQTKAVLLLESQPPHLGEMMQIIQLLKRFSFLHICLVAKPAVMEIKAAVGIWTALLQPYVGKVQLGVFAGKFTDIAKDDLPKLYDDCTYQTASREIFVHLSTMNVSVELIPRALGYNTTFIRTAFRQSKALDWLENKFINMINGKR